MSACLTLSIIRYGLRVKWSNSGNGVVAIEKGAFGLPLTKAANLYTHVSLLTET